MRQMLSNASLWWGVCGIGVLLLAAIAANLAMWLRLNPLIGDAELFRLRGQILSLRDGDYLILMTGEKLSVKAYEKLAATWAEWVRDLGLPGAKALLLERGMTITVLRSESDPTPAH